MSDKHWSVNVMVNGENVLYISHNELSGVDNIEDYADEIRFAAENLLAFIGKSESYEFAEEKTKDGECTCSCIDCIEGNHCGGLFIVDTEDGEEVVGECKNIDGVLNAMEENGMFGRECEDEYTDNDEDDPWEGENPNPILNS